MGIAYASRCPIWQAQVAAAKGPKRPTNPRAGDPQLRRRARAGPKVPVHRWKRSRSRRLAPGESAPPIYPYQTVPIRPARIPNTDIHIQLSLLKTGEDGHLEQTSMYVER